MHLSHVFVGRCLGLLDSLLLHHGLPLALLKPLQLFGEYVDLGQQLDLVIAQLCDLIHHFLSLVLSLSAALSGALAVFQ